MRTVFIAPAFSIAVTAALTTYLGWDKEAAVIGGLALAGCLTFMAIGIEDTIRERREKEQQQREMEHWRQAERRRAAAEKTRASPKQPKKDRARAVQPKKERASAVQPKKSRASAKRPKKEPGRSPS
jgi:murein L,D-transpeptidase YafK